MAATDQRFRIIFEGVEQDAIAKIQNVVKGLNTATQATKQFSRERQQLARAERQDRFRSLSDEEKYQRLLQRRETLERRIATARARGNETRVQALELSLARNRSALGRQRSFSSAPPVISGSLPPIIQAAAPGLIGRLGGALTGMLAGRAGGGILGGLLGAAGGPLGIAAGIGGGLILGDLAKRLTSALADSVESTVRFADEISDMADQMGLSNREVLNLRNASGTAGVKNGKAFQGLASLAAARSAAMGGDERSLALFQRYGIDPAMLDSSMSDLQIASKIFGSLGSAGATAADAGPLRALFGKRPEQMMSVLKAYAALSGSAAKDTEEAVAQLGAISDKMDQIGTAWQIFKVKVVSAAIQFWKDHAALMGSIAGAAINYAGPFLAAFGNPMLSKALGKLGTMAIGAANEAGLLGSSGNQSNSNRTAPPEAFSFSPETPAVNKLGPFAAADALARIGGFRGPIDPDRVDVFKQQLSELRKIRQSQEKTATGLQLNLT